MTSSGLRIEWAKSEARAARWWEEVNLLREEMRRAVVFCEWKSQWWREHAERPRPDLAVEVREGIQAYAFAHANAEARLASRWLEKWRPLLTKADEFMREYPMLVLDEGAAPAEAQAPNAGDGEGHGNDGDGLVNNGNGDGAADGEGDGDDAADGEDDRDNGDDAIDPVGGGVPGPPVPIVELELDDVDDWADDYDFHADDF